MSLLDKMMSCEEADTCRAIRDLARRYDVPVVTAKAVELTPEQLARYWSEPLMLEEIRGRQVSETIDLMISTTQIDPKTWAQDVVLHVAKERAKADQGKYVFVDSYAELRFD